VDAVAVRQGGRGAGGGGGEMTEENPFKLPDGAPMIRWRKRIRLILMAVVFFLILIGLLFSLLSDQSLKSKVPEDEWRDRPSRKSE
jgi:hypothetical protein